MDERRGSGTEDGEECALEKPADSRCLDQHHREHGREGLHEHVTRTHVAWTASRGAPYTPSPVIAGDALYYVSDTGILSAADARTGKLLWQFNAGAGCNAAPIAFEFKNEQFIAVACGGNYQLSFPLGDAVFVFGFPKTWTP